MKPSSIIIFTLRITKSSTESSLLKSGNQIHQRVSSSHNFSCQLLTHGELSTLQMPFWINQSQFTHQLLLSKTVFCWSVVQVLPKHHQCWCGHQSLTQLFNCSSVSTSRQPHLQVCSKPQSSKNVTTKWVKIMDHPKISISPFSSMIWACRSSTSGAIKLPWKSSDNWLNKMDFTGSTKPKEVTSRTSRICPSSVPWITQEVVETTFQTDSRDNSLFSTWFCHCQLRAFTDQSLSSSSESMLKTQVCQKKWRKLSRTWHQPPLSCGNSSKNSCFPPQPSSITCSTCVNSLVLSRVFSRSRRNQSWRLTE